MLIPTLTVRDVGEAVAFYTGVLDFERATPSPEIASFYAVLTRGGDELHLSRCAEEGAPSRGAAILLCDDVDAQLATYQSRGLELPLRPESPVHEGPVDQTWGTREVYIDDPSGNTIILQQR